MRHPREHRTLLRPGALSAGVLAALGSLTLVAQGAGVRPPGVLEDRARRGSSLAGSVIEDDGRPVPNCLVVARVHDPRALPDDPPLPTFSVHTDARGAFELRGLAAGAYALRATVPGRSSLLEIRTLRRGQAERLEAPLVVRPPQPLELRFDPPRDPSGDPWLLSVRGELGLANPPALEMPVADGRWAHPGLVLDRYVVTVGDSRGNTWRRLVAVVAGPTTLDLDLGSVPVAGQISLGGQPLAARLLFVAAGARLQVDTDADGRYRAFLPDWDWRGSSSAWQLTLRAPHVARRLLVHLGWPPGGRAASYGIDLPATTLRGVVTDEGGAPLAEDAWLVFPDQGLWSRSGDRREPPLTLPVEPPGPEGAPREFLVRGLPPETSSLMAEGQHSASPPVACGFSGKGEGRAGPLALRPVVRVGVRLLDSRGLLDSPRVIAAPIGPAGGAREHLAWDGTLELTLPGDTTELAMAVAGREQELLLVRVAVSDGARVALRLPDARARLKLGQDLAGWPRRLFLFNERQAVELDALRRLGVALAPGADGSLLVAVPPGRYALCALTDAEAQRAMLGGAEPAGCAKGVAAEGTELHLSLQPSR